MRLPRTSESRRDPGFLRLITDVDVYAPPGLQFRGRLLTPGAAFNAPDLPRPALLVEYAGRVRTAKTASVYSFSSLWVLWRFDFDADTWEEVIRATSRDAAWSIDFAPIVERLLIDERVEYEWERARPEVERITRMLEVELNGATRQVRCHILAALDTFVAAEIVKGRSGQRVAAPAPARTHESTHPAHDVSIARRA